MQRWKKHLWTGTLLGVAVALILAAVAMGAVRLLDLAAPKYRDRLAAEMSESLELPVTIAGIGMRWKGFRPTFELDEVIVLDEQRRPAFQVAHIGLPFKWSSLLQGELFPYQIELEGMAVALEWRADGSVGIRGVGQAAEGGELDLSEILSYLEKISRIEVVDGVVNWSDFGALIGLTRVEQVNASVEKTGPGLKISLNGRLPKHLGEGFNLVAQVNGVLTQPDELEISTRFSAPSLYPDGWLAPLLRETAALRGGPLKVQFSSNWRGLEFRNAAFRLDLNSLRNVGSEKEHRLPGLNAELQITPLGDGWKMDIQSLQYKYGNDKSPVARGNFRYQPTPDGFGTRLDAELDTMRVSDLVAWLSVMDAGMEIPLPTGGGAAGQLLDTRFEYYRAPGGIPQFEMSSRMKDFALPPAGGLPGVSGLSGQVYATQDAGRFETVANNGSLEIPALFEQSMPLENFKAEIMWEKSGPAWRVFSENLVLNTLGVTSNGQLELLLDEEPSPRIDLHLDFQASDIKPLIPYIPLPPVLPEGVGNWLRASLKDGRVPQGKFDLKGRLADFPYEKPGEKGVFKIAFQAEDVDLEYAPGWPVVEAIHGDAVFKGRSMRVDAKSGRILGLPIQQTVARIPDFLEPILIVRGKVLADVGKQLAFLDASPLRENYQGLLQAISIDGPGQLDLEMDMPLADVEQVRIAGDIDLQGVQLKYSDMSVPVSDIRGSLRFSESGLAAESLKGRFIGLPVMASLTPVKGDRQGLTQLKAIADVRMPQHLPQLSEYAARDILQAFSGQTEVHLESTFDSSASSSEMVVYSDMRGMQVTLGEPFNKKADEKRQVRVAVKPVSGQTQVSWRYAGELQGVLGYQSAADQYQLQSGRILLGDTVSELSLPAKPGFQIDGKLPVLDLNRLVSGPASSKPLPPLSINAEFGELRVAEQQFKNIRLQTTGADKLANDKQGVVKITGDSIDGTMQWKSLADGRLDIEADFERLYLRVPQNLADNAKAAEEDQQQKKEVIDPGRLPIVNLSAKVFRLGDEGLGSFKLVTQPVDTGLRLSVLEIGGRRIEVRGGGEWTRENNLSSARLVMNVNGNDLVGLLNATGYAPSITARQSDIFMELDWSPSAAGLQLEKLNGKMSFDLKDGSLLEVKPGAGRVLSLLSFYSLPRRLTLDFSDVLGKGTAFDELTGVFAIQNGDATTDNLVVVSPSARIEVRGRVGLAAQDYDQTVTIYPGIASGVALAGAVLGGPVLGIGLWIAQELLDKPFDQVAKVSYRLTGSWDDPKVEPLDAEARKVKKKPAKTPAADQSTPKKNSPDITSPDAPVSNEATTETSNESSSP